MVSGIQSDYQKLGWGLYSQGLVLSLSGVSWLSSTSVLHSLHRQRQAFPVYFLRTQKLKRKLTSTLSDLK